MTWKYAGNYFNSFLFTSWPKIWFILEKVLCAFEKIVYSVVGRNTVGMLSPFAQWCALTAVCESRVLKILYPHDSTSICPFKPNNCVMKLGESTLRAQILQVLSLPVDLFPLPVCSGHFCLFWLVLTWSLLCLKIRWLLLPVLGLWLNGVPFSILSLLVYILAFGWGVSPVGNIWLH